MEKNRWMPVLYALQFVGAAVLVSTLVFLSSPDFVVNTFLKGRITNAFEEAYPEYTIHIGGMRYSIGENRIGFDSVALTARDSTLSGTIVAYSVSGIGWLQLLWARGLVPVGFAGSVLDAHGIVVTFPREQYELHCELLRISVPDSEMVLKALTLQPLTDDEQFFAESTFRKTRFRLKASDATLTGLACLDLLQGKNYRTRSAQIHDVLVDVLINKDKPAAADTSSPPMPNEVLALIGKTFAVDTLNIGNGRLMYGERFAVRSTPALISLDGMHVMVQGISNHGNRATALVIHAEGNLMKTGTMKVLMSIPAASSGLSLEYSGSVTTMDLRVFNSFLETAEHMRIKEGTLQTATFKVNVASGRASGNVRVFYRDLTFAAINEETGSESGLGDAITSFMASTFKIRRTNVPDETGAIKVGEVDYTRKREESFLEFTWLALRSGLGDVVGF
jgi:hypothetical protein